MIRALLVDDEPAVTKGLLAMVDWSSLDIVVISCVSSALDALALLHQEHIDLIITDICMPHMDGITFISNVRQQYPGIRFIVVSAHEDFQYVRQALTLGVDNYLLKPINASELLETLEKTLLNLRLASTYPPEMLAFRTNILDRWVSGSIQDFELLERAEVLRIDLSARQFQCLIAAARDPISTEERLKRSAALVAIVAQALPRDIASEVFVDRNANVTAILRGNTLDSLRSAIAGSFSSLAAKHNIVAALGNTVDNPYTLAQSNRSAYEALRLRHLRQGSVFSAAELPDVGRNCPALMQFQQALENFNTPAAVKAIDMQVQAEKFQGPWGRRVLLAFALRLAGELDGFPEKPRTIPADILHGLQKLEALASPAQTAEALAICCKQALRWLVELRSSMHPAVLRAMAETSACPEGNLTIKTMAEKLNMNPSYFGQLFKAETGLSFNDYLTSLRMRTARDQLTTTNLKISQIAASVGISQQSYFNRLFRKEYGVTPMEYRQATRISL